MSKSYIPLIFALIMIWGSCALALFKIIDIGIYIIIVLLAIFIELLFIKIFSL